MKTCLKCGFVNNADQVAATAACPNCGAIYAKVEAAATSPAPIAPHPAASTPPKQHTTRSLALAALATLVVGFFAGREHMRYQIAMKFAEGFAKVGEAFADKPQTQPRQEQASAPEPPPAAPPKPPSPIVAVLQGKSFADRDFRDANTVKVRFTVNSRKNVRAFDGVLVFEDLLGNRILAAKVAINEPIAAGQHFVWDGEVPYNQFDRDDIAFRNAEQANIVLKFLPGKVLFADGERQDFN